MKPEILAPAGNLETFFVAVNNGADAVYLGLKDFNARGNIQNFTFEELKQAIDFAHLFGVKVYLAMNTLVKTDEIQEVLAKAQKAYLLGVDAFILQDLGLASLIKKTCPNAVLHASTQMGIHNLEGAKFAEKFGFKRIVLSRETLIPEIKRIKENTSLEIEYFVQGALCVAFSGNCYLCSLLTGNSGNRGKCQQFCRLPYEINGLAGCDEGYLLSTKDFCMLPILKELAGAGVESFKIEGRARRSGYVAECVRTYKKCLEENFNFEEEDVQRLKVAFNRGDFATGYLNNEQIIFKRTQNHKGIEIGRVEKVDLGKKFNILKIRSSREISAGDGLKFFKNGKEVGSIGVGDVRLVGGVYNISTTAKIPENSKVHLTVDSKRDEELLSIKRKRSICADFVAKVGQKAQLTLKTGGVQVTVWSEDVLQKADKQPLTEEEVKIQLSKFGDEPFEIEDFKTSIENVFMRKAELNLLRRSAVEMLKNEILKDFHERTISLLSKNEKIGTKEENKDNQKSGRMLVFKEINKVLSFDFKQNDIAVFSPEKYIKEEINKFASYCVKLKIKHALDLPIYAESRDIKLFNEIFHENEYMQAIANNLYVFDLLKPDRIIVGMGLNVYNNNSIEMFEKMGVKKIVVSRELKNFEMEELSCDATLFAFSEGKEEYMTLKHCPFKEFFNSRCDKCVYCEGMTYTMQNGKKLLLERKKVCSCQFVLRSEDVKKQKVCLNPLIEIK